MKPWDRQPREGALAFAAFSRFLELGPDRSFALVAQDSTLSMTETKVKSLAKKWNWRERSAEWEAFLAEAQRKRQQKIYESEAEKWARRRVELREKEYGTADRLMDRANEILDLDLHEKVESDFVMAYDKAGNPIQIPTTITWKPLRVKSGDATSALSTASQVMRLSSEMATSHDRLDVNVNDKEKQLELAKAALKSLRDEVMDDLVKTRPDLIPQAMKRLTGWIAESFQIEPELLEMDNAQAASESVMEESPAPVAQEPMIEVEEDEIPDVIEAEYVDLPRPEAVNGNG